MLFTGLFLISAHLVVSLDANKCGSPPVYQDKQLDEKYGARHEFYDGEKVRYKCTYGYTPLPGGSRESLCHRGQWTSLNLQCVRKTCGSPGDIQNGRFDLNGNVFGDRAYAVCNEGYVLQGDAVRECLLHGWSGTVPSCVAATCRPLQIQYGQVMIHNDRYNTQARITCNKGFMLNGPSVVSCANGNWMPDPPTCVREVNCKQPTIQNAKIMKDKQKSEAMITCYKGFTLSGPNVVTCGANGAWMPSLPICVREVQCQPLTVQNGFVRKDKQRMNTQIITCKKGFMLRGPNTVTCMNGSWMPSIPMCVQEVQCQQLSVQNGFVRKDKQRMNTHIISCKKGFMLSGPNTVTCMNGSWMPSLPMCVQGGQMEVTCPPPAVQNSKELHIYKPYRVGEIAIIICQENFMLRGSSEARCGPNGQWQLNAQCVPTGGKRCGSAGEIMNGRFHYTGASFGDTATAVCDEGYLLVGFGTRHCKAEGWDGRIPECEVVQCPQPPMVHGAEVYVGTSGMITYRQTASYRCRTGRLIGDSDIYCTKHGNWSGPPPRCQEPCPKPVLMGGLIVSGYRHTYQPGNVVAMRCNPGYKLLGSGVITCGEDGVWKPGLPHCMN